MHIQGRTDMPGPWVHTLIVDPASLNDITKAANQHQTVIFFSLQMSESRMKWKKLLELLLFYKFPNFKEEKS